MSSDPAIVACRKIIAYICDDLKAVIFANQLVAASPRPEKPYAAIRWLSSREVAQYRKSKWVDDEGWKATWKQQSYKDALMRVDFYGSGANEFAYRLISSDTRPDVRAEMVGHLDDTGNDIGLRMLLSGGLVTDSTGLLDTSHEESSYVDFRVYWIDHIMAETVRIDTVTIVGGEDLDGILETIDVSTTGE